MDLDFLSMNECATRLSISTQAVHRLCTRGTLAYVRIGGRRYIRVRTLNEYLANDELQARRRQPSAVRCGQRVLTLDEAVEDVKVSVRSRGVVK